ncbi:YiiX/YebB-like N1pC/P60 family cysteine hydrolase [Brevibacillus brevis]|uniref:YiiX/YebB-like N1pC/P60 family cysteine hydrolase n=1 Tax=Brevibacillus brevis TaxID=1393 RepID=UPI0037CA1B8C
MFSRKSSSILLLFIMIFTLCTSVGFAAEVKPLEDDPGVYYPGTHTKAKPGDMLVSNTTSSKGLTGHAAIVTDNLSVVHIGGYGENPEEISLSKFFKRYNNSVKVIRYTSSRDAKKAGEWARTYAAEYSDAKYDLAVKLRGFTHTYCSKIVWQAYYYGADVNLGNKRPSSTQLFEPYAILDLDDTREVEETGSW